MERLQIRAQLTSLFNPVLLSFPPVAGTRPSPAGRINRLFASIRGAAQRRNQPVRLVLLSLPVVLFAACLASMALMNSGNRAVLILEIAIFILALNLAPEIARYLVPDSLGTSIWGCILLFIVIVLGLVRRFPSSNWQLLSMFVGLCIVTLEVGGNLVTYYYSRISGLVQKEYRNSVDPLSPILDKFRSSNAKIYQTITYGAIAGLLIALLFPGRDPAWFTLVGATGLFSVGLLVAVLRGFWAMCNPMFTPETAELPEAQREEAELIAAGMITKVRRVYLYDALHNVFILDLLLLFVASVLGFHVAEHWLGILLGFLFSVFLANEIPFCIGQLLLRQKILDSHVEKERQEIEPKIHSAAPLSPQVVVLLSQALSTGAGAVLFTLGEYLLKEKAKS